MYQYGICERCGVVYNWLDKITGITLQFLELLAVLAIIGLITAAMFYVIKKTKNLGTQNKE